MSKYHLVHIYTTKGNLLSYFASKEGNYTMSAKYIDLMRKRYEQEREIQLIALFRYEGNKCFCKIKCPVNPLPIKGEFEAPSINAIVAFLQKDGWQLKQKLSTYMFE